MINRNLYQTLCASVYDTSKTKYTEIVSVSPLTCKRVSRKLLKVEEAPKDNAGLWFNSSDLTTVPPSGRNLITTWTNPVDGISFRGDFS